MPLMQLTVIPLGTGSASVGDFVIDFQHLLLKENFNYKLTDMGTTVEGETRELLALAAKIHDMPFAKGVQRVVTQITIDERRDKSVKIGDKVHSVQERL